MLQINETSDFLFTGVDDVIGDDVTSLLNIGDGIIGDDVTPRLHIGDDVIFILSIDDVTGDRFSSTDDVFSLALIAER